MVTKTRKTRSPTRRFKKTLIWSIINEEEHPALTGDERTIEGAMPVVETLFPGMNYYSISGFAHVQNNYLRPVLTKLFPYLKGLRAEEIRESERVALGTFLPSRGYEHTDNPRWRIRLDALLQQ